MSDASQKSSVSLRDIAAAAGVNPSTVSRALRDDLRLRPETRRQIQELSRNMQYRPNPFVTAFTTHVRNHRALPAGQASIAILITTRSPNLDPAEIWVRRYEEGARGRASEQGFSVDRLLIGGDSLDSAKAGRIIRARGIRGVIVMPVLGMTAITGIDFRSLASATIDLSLKSPMLHRASPDYFRSMTLALDKLRAKRYRRIGFCANGGEIRRIGQRWLGAFLAWQSEGPPEERVEPYIGPTEEILPEGSTQPPPTWRQCRDAFTRWLEKEKPDAIVSNCFYFEEWLRELGLKIPGDIAFASLGLNLGISTQSGIDQRSEQVGAEAMDLVAAQIYRNEYGLPLIPSTVLVPPIWLDGNTTL